MNIRCEKVRIGYGQNIVLDNLDAHFPSGAINVVLGPSGSGKSTLLKAIAAMEDPFSGFIYYDDKPHNKLCPRVIREKVGMIFQKPTMFEGTVYDNLIYGLIQQKKAIDRKSIEHTLEQLNIPSHYLDKKGNELSVGEQQRVCIIRSLLPSPEVVLLDEPTSALDPQTSKRVLNLIKKLNTDFDKTVIMVSHDIEESIQIADNIFFLSKNELVSLGTPEELERQKEDGIEDDFIKRFLAGEL